MLSLLGSRSLEKIEEVGDWLLLALRPKDKLSDGVLPSCDVGE